MLFAPSSSRSYGSLLEHWSGPIEDKHRTNFVEQKPADSSEESHDVCVTNELPLLVPHRA